MPNAGATAVDHLRTRTIDGKEHRVRATHYVMACGAIHTARLLLASRSRTPRGLGNDRDIVGRYFMEHFEIIAGQAVFEGKTFPSKLYAYPGRGAKGARAELDLGRLLARRATVAGTTLRSRPAPEKARIVHEVLTHVWPMVEDGRVRPVVHARVPLDEARRAHELLESGDVFGKVLLVP